MNAKFNSLLERFESSISTQLFVMFLVEVLILCLCPFFDTCNRLKNENTTLVDDKTQENIIQQEIVESVSDSLLSPQ